MSYRAQHPPIFLSKTTLWGWLSWERRTGPSHPESSVWPLYSQSDLFTNTAYQLTVPAKTILCNPNQKWPFSRVRVLNNCIVLILSYWKHNAISDIVIEGCICNSRIYTTWWSSENNNWLSFVLFWCCVEVCWIGSIIRKLSYSFKHISQLARCCTESLLI